MCLLKRRCTPLGRHWHSTCRHPPSHPLSLISTCHRRNPPLPLCRFSRPLSPILTCRHPLPLPSPWFPPATTLLATYCESSYWNPLLCHPLHLTPPTCLYFHPVSRYSPVNVNLDGGKFSFAFYVTADFILSIQPRFLRRPIIQMRFKAATKEFSPYREHSLINLLLRDVILQSSQQLSLHFTQIEPCGRSAPLLCLLGWWR